ncbi:hypothetical protein BDW59DRAFT_149652 [Aspergillus cavernicola]|uniref:BHLH domain-containing protein n=1 Tax=Aspergillus cavernicola TaxID=176166 RepID=A0ABR4I4S8_9EURO
MALSHRDPNRKVLDAFNMSNQTTNMDETTSLPWGTDPSFGPSGYSPHPDIPNQDIMEDELTQIYFNFLDFSVGNPTIQDHDLVEVQVDKRERGKNEGGNGPTSKRRRQHILSERNRRTQQSKLYDEICSLIPGVCPKRCTKSELLMRAAGWLGDLTEGNRKLKEQLACLSSDRGYS